MPWPPLNGRWSVYEASPGTTSGGAWTALTDQSGGGNDITPVSGTVPVLTGYAPGAATDVCDISASDVFRAGKSGGWGSFGTGGAIFVKCPWDASFDNQSSRFSIRTGGYGTGGSVSTLFTLRHGVGDEVSLHLSESFSGPGYLGPVWTGVPLAGTGDPAHWIQYAIRWVVTGTSIDWRVVIIGDRGLGVQIYVNESFTSAGIDAAFLARIVTAMQLHAPRGGSLGYWYGDMPDEDFTDAVIADADELGEDVTELVVPGVYDCECTEAEYGFRVVFEFAGLVEQFNSVDGSITETLDFFELSAGDRSFPLTITPVEIDVPALLLDGHRLDEAVVRIYRGDTLVMVGRPEAPRWSRAGEPIRFTVREDPWLQANLFPSAWDQRVTMVDTAAVAALEAAEVGGLQGIPIGSAHGYGYRPPLDNRDAVNSNVPPYVSALGLTLYVDKVSGRAGPIVFGSPGYQEGTAWGATPAYWVDTTEGSERLMVARHRVAAANVTVFGTCVDGIVRGKVAPIEHLTTPSGVTIAVADISSGIAVQPRLSIQSTWNSAMSYSVTVDVTYVVGGLPSVATVPVTQVLAWGAGADYDAMRDALILELQNEFPQATSIVQTGDADPVATVAVTLPVAYDLAVTATSGAVVATPSGVGVTIAGNEDFQINYSADWAIGWHDGEGLPGGAGDVINYLLNQTTIRLDRGRLESYRSLLNSYTLAGYIDSQVDVMEYISSQLAFMPISFVSGKEGLYTWLYDEEVIRQPVATLTEADNFRIEGDVALSSKEPIRQVQLSYRHREDTAGGSLVTTQRSLSARTSSGQVEDLQTDLVDDSATAERAASLRQRALGERHPVVVGTVGPELDWLRAGDPVRLVAPSRGVNGYALCTELLDDGTPRSFVSLTVL